MNESQLLSLSLSLPCVACRTNGRTNNHWTESASPRITQRTSPSGGREESCLPPGFLSFFLSFLLSSIHSFIHSFVRSFVCLFIHSFCSLARSLRHGGGSLLFFKQTHSCCEIRLPRDGERLGPDGDASFDVWRQISG